MGPQLVLKCDREARAGADGWSVLVTHLIVGKKAFAEMGYVENMCFNVNDTLTHSHTPHTVSHPSGICPGEIRKCSSVLREVDALSSAVVKDYNNYAGCDCGFPSVQPLNCHITLVLANKKNKQQPTAG